MIKFEILLMIKEGIQAKINFNLNFLNFHHFLKIYFGLLINYYQFHFSHP
jgi:hypothetical protein